MGWFRAMGADTVGYHKETVMDRADDHPGQALDYYASRGETPLRWGGAVAARLGLVGKVTPDQYEAAFGPGGFRDPLTGERVVPTKTPGFEIVVAAHKSTAVLGVIGRAEDMHTILDVETTATMDWLEASMQRTGGRRGRAATVTPTTGLAYAVTRHGTSRAGDPSPHDHVLVANLTEMLDTRGGHKALFSALLRDRIEAATMVGRLHSAYQAITLGYTIELDNGPSGRLRHWRIHGIPQVVCDKLSKRSDAIGEYLSEHGYVGYRARNIAARATREVKRGTGIDELQPRWEAELAEIGWPVDRIAAALEAARTRSGPARPLTDYEIDALAAELLDVDGPFLARGKVFTRTRLIADVAPRLYGHHPAELDHVLGRILASPLVTPLIGVAGAREHVYTATAVLETEHTIAACVERLVGADGPRLDPDRIRQAITAQQDQIGAPLSAGQRQAVNSICGSGRAVDVVVGIAGSGKTTALDAAATALADAGYQVIGTATSGQAARTLGHEAGIDARTMRSLLWHLDHGTITLDRHTVVILDEAGMTADNDMARLLLAVEAARAKVVIVGDDRQLSPVGPGGALHQTLTDRPDVVTTLTRNLRQRDPAERDALLHLRSGDLDHAIDWYADNDRIAVADDPLHALVAMVDAWATDTEADHETFLLAWRRTNVAALNRLARDQARQRSWLRGPDLQTADGRLFAVGDTVVTLAPNHRGGLVTSERARVVAIHPDTDALTIATADDRHVTLHGPDVAPDRLAHGYALTVHREEGATSDRTHYYSDGGGRELAYVALSRARHHTTIHTVADTLDHSLDRLRDDWTQERHDTWLTPTTEMGHDSRHDPAAPTTTRADLEAELAQLRALAPSDVTSDIAATTSRLTRLRADRDHLIAGTGPYHDTPAGQAARALHTLDRDLANARHHLTESRLPWDRRHWLRVITTFESLRPDRLAAWHDHTHPEATRLDHSIASTQVRLDGLQQQHRDAREWHRVHPDYNQRLCALERAISDIDGPQSTHSTERSRDTKVDEQRRDASAQADAILDRLRRHELTAIDPPRRDLGGLGL